MEDYSIRWNDNRMLKFLVDFYVYRRFRGNNGDEHEVGDKDFSCLLYYMEELDHLVFHIMNLRGVFECSENKHSPWHTSNIHQYLVEEDMSKPWVDTEDWSSHLPTPRWSS